MHSLLQNNKNKNNSVYINIYGRMQVLLVFIHFQQLCTCSTLFCTFLCSCFTRLQRETSKDVTRYTKLHVLWRTDVVCVPVSLFFFSLPLIFTWLAASISHLLIAAIKFSRFSSNKLGLLCFLSPALAPSLLSTLM